MQSSQKTKDASAFPAYADMLVYGGCIALGLFHFYSYMRAESFAPDSSYYIGVAEAIREKGKYEFNFAPHLLYPPGYPMLLALISLLFGSSYFVFVRAAAIMGTFGLIASYQLLRRMEGRGVAASGCVILGLSQHYFFQVAQVVGSDVPYFLSTNLLLVLVIRSEQSLDFLRRGVVRVLIAILLVISILLRTAGVTLLIGICISLLVGAFTNRKAVLERAKCLAPGLVAAALLLGGWMLWTQAAKNETKSYVRESETYVDQFWLVDPLRPESGRAGLSDLLKRPERNALVHGAYISRITFRVPWVEPLLYSPVVLASLTLVFLGWVWSVRKTRGDGFPEWYFASYVAVYLLWPFDVGPRFVFAVFPLIFVYLYRGALWLKTARVWESSVWSRIFLVVSMGLAMYAVADVLPQWSQVSLQARASMLFWVLLTLILGLALIGVRTGLLHAFLSAKGHVTGLQLVKPGIVMVVSLAAITGLVQQAELASWNLDPPVREFVHQPAKDAADWLVAHTLRSDIVMAQQVSILHRVSKRLIVSFPVRSDPREIMAVIQKFRIKFLVAITAEKSRVLSPTESERARLLEAAFPEQVKLVQRSNTYLIYEIFGAPTVNAARPG